MNTRAMLDAARQEKMKPDVIQAYCVWALVSQMERGYMTVGQVGDLVKQCSGFKPSTYQVNRVMANLSEMGVVQSSELRRNAKGIVMGWKAEDTCIGLLYVHQWRFVKNDELWNAVYNLTERVNFAVIAIAKDLRNYNRQIDSSIEGGL